MPEIFHLFLCFTIIYEYYLYCCINILPDFIVYRQLLNNAMFLNKSPPIFIKTSAFIGKERYLVFCLKYSSWLATTFSQLLGIIRIRSLHLFWYSHMMCWSNRPCAIDQNKWSSEGATPVNTTGEVGLLHWVFSSKFPYEQAFSLKRIILLCSE